MIAISRRFFPIGRRSGAADVRRSRGTVPRPIDGLEPRALRSVVALVANASPAVLRPINPMNQPHAVRVARIRPVTLAGYAGTDGDGDVAPALTFRVVDEYGHDQPSGTFSPQRAQPGVFFFDTRIGLSLRRRPGDRDGRQYTVLINAQDAQSSRTIVIPVSTPPVRSGHGARQG